MRIRELEATSRAEERRSRAIPGRSRAEAREALRASERTQSNEVRRHLEALAVLDQASEQRQGGLDPVAAFRYHPYCPRWRGRPAGDHRPRRFIAFFSAQISKGNTRLAYRDLGGPASR